MEKSTADKFNKVAKIYDTPIFQFFYFFAHKSCIQFLRNYIKDNYSILDVACGTGIFLKKINKKYRGLKLCGIDNSEEMISSANKQSGTITFKTASAEKIPFENNSFDLVMVIDAFYYFQDKETALKECSRVLKPDCHLFLFYPAADIFPNFFLKQIKFISRFLFFNLEEYSSFPKMKELEKIAHKANLKLITKKIKSMNRFILFQKNKTS
ncbi:MAG: methyltransferase domain-containing protein [Candidatus Staskawiczbacteria bacterium]|nr:methyltransferase domain-containing protein [Candidatus Staskawiczbacteria bacterium]